MILVGTNQKSSIEDLGYSELMLLFEYWKQPDAFRLPAVNGTELASPKKPTASFGQLTRDYSISSTLGVVAMRVLGENALLSPLVLEEVRSNLVIGNGQRLLNVSIRRAGVCRRS